MSNRVMVVPDENGNPANVSHGTLAALNIAASVVLQQTKGRIVRINVTTAGSAAGAVHDTDAIASAAAGTLIAVIPNTVGIYYLDFPCLKGITIIIGTGQVVSVSYS